MTIEDLLDAPTLMPEPEEPSDPNVWMLPPEIVTAIVECYREAREDLFSSSLTQTDAIWLYCFGELPLPTQAREVRRAIFAGRASGSVLLIRRPLVGTP